MKKQVSIYLDIEQIKEVKHRAVDLDLNVSDYIAMLIMEDLNHGRNISN